MRRQARLPSGVRRPVAARARFRSTATAVRNRPSLLMRHFLFYFSLDFQALKTMLAGSEPTEHRATCALRGAATGTGWRNRTALTHRCRSLQARAWARSTDGCLFQAGHAMRSYLPRVFLPRPLCPFAFVPWIVLLLKLIRNLRT